jgi:hypothetical protein
LICEKLMEDSMTHVIFVIQIIISKIAESVVREQGYPVGILMMGSCVIHQQMAANVKVSR